MEAKASAPPRESEGHSKAYFDAIHSCLDGLMMEINSATANTVIASHLLTIVHPLLYTHIVSVVAEGFLGHAVSAIQTYHNSQDSVASTSSARGLEGDYLLVLTQTKLLLLSPLPAEMSRERECGEAVQSVERGKEEVIERGKEEVIERVKEEGMEGVKTETKEHSKEVKEERSEELEEETHSDTNEAKEMVLVSTIADALEVFTSCSEEDIKELDWVNCDSFRVDFELTLSDVQMLNILVNEEKGNEQLIHIKVNEETSLFLQVDYPIFVVNELMNRIGHLQCCVCWESLFHFLCPFCTPNLCLIGVASVASFPNICTGDYVNSNRIEFPLLLNAVSPQSFLFQECVGITSRVFTE